MRIALATTIFLLAIAALVVSVEKGKPTIINHPAFVIGTFLGLIALGVALILWV